MLKQFCGYISIIGKPNVGKSTILNSILDKKVSIIRTEQSEKEKLLKSKARKGESEFYKRIYPLLYELLLDRGGSVLVDQRNVILWNSSSDITDDAIKLINRQLDSSTQ